MYGLAIGFQNFSVPIGNQDRVNAVFEKFAITLVGGAQPLVELRVLDGGACQTAETGHYQQRIGIERAADRVDGLDHADHPGLGLDRGGGHRLGADPAEAVRVGEAFVRAGGGDHQPASLAHHQSDQTLARGHAAVDDVAGVLPGGGAEDQFAGLRVGQGHGGGLHLQGLHGLVEDALKHFLHPQGGIDGGRALGQRCHHACLALALGIQPRVQHGHTGLVGDGLH